MTDTPFTVATTTQGDDALLALGGRVDRDAEADLLAAATTATSAGAGRLVLDFAGTTYINSSGLAAIVALLAEARDGDVTVAARGLTPHYRHLFEITRLSDLIEVEPEPTPGVA